MLKILHYQGNTHPIIRVDADSKEDIRWLARVFYDLAESKSHEAYFQHSEQMPCIDFQRLILRVVQKPQRKKFTKSASQREFCWFQTTNEWSDCVWLLSGLLKAKQLGHQYFTSEGRDDALVVVALGEKSSS